MSSLMDFCDNIKLINIHVLVEEAGIRVVLQGESFVCLSRFLVLKPVLVEGVFSFFSIVYFPGFIWGYLSCPIYWSTVL